MNRTFVGFSWSKIFLGGYHSQVSKYQENMRADITDTTWPTELYWSRCPSPCSVALFLQPWPHGGKSTLVHPSFGLNHFGQKNVRLCSLMAMPSSWDEHVPSCPMVPEEWEACGVKLPSQSVDGEPRNKCLLFDAAELWGRVLHAIIMVIMLYYLYNCQTRTRKDKNSWNCHHFVIKHNLKNRKNII